MGPKLNPTNSLLKHGVMNDKGENLGKIEELLIDLETGQIMFAVLSYGGFGRAKYFTVPWELLRFSTHDKKYILDVPRQTIENGAGYESMDKVTEKADTNWLGDRFEYYSNKPEWEKRREEERRAELQRLEDRRAEIKSTISKQEAI